MKQPYLTTKILALKTTNKYTHKSYENKQLLLLTFTNENVRGTKPDRNIGTASGMVDEAYAFYKRLASLLSDKWNENYATVMGWIRCCLSFSLLRSAIRCLRGSWSSASMFGCPVLATSVELVQAETGLSSLLSN